MNNEAILNKLIELGYVEIEKFDNLTAYKDADKSSWMLDEFDAIESATDFLLVQRALFDECAKRDLTLIIDDTGLYIYENFLGQMQDLIFEAIDTSRESFRAAFCKVTGERHE